MGNFITREDKIEDIIEEITISNKFKEYQEKFYELVPSYDLSITDGELVIEVIKKTSYSVVQYYYDWLDPNDINLMYIDLDKLYQGYSLSYINSSSNNVNDIIKYDTIIQKCVEDDCHVHLVYDKIIEIKNLFCYKHK